MPYHFETPKLSFSISKPQKIGNLAARMSAQERCALAQHIVELVEIDQQSMSDWLGKAEGYLNKFDNDGNDAGSTNREEAGSGEDQKTPSTSMLVTSVIQFAARVTGQILAGPDLAKPSEPNDAAAIALSDWINRQLRTEDTDWVIETDPLVLHMGVTGLAWRKRWYDDHEGQLRSAFLACTEVIVNAGALSVDRVPRITHKFERYPYEIQRLIEMKRWVDYEPRFDDIDPQAPQLCYETDLWLDLDGDEYDEPWTVTVALDDTPEVVKIEPRWSSRTVVDTKEMLIFHPHRRYHPYKLLPDPKGGFFPRGFGALLDAAEANADTLLAAICDTAKSSAQNGGVYASSTAMPDKIELKPNRLVGVPLDGMKLTDSLQMLPVKQVTPGMVQILDKMITLGDRIAGTLNLLENAPASMTATLAKGIIDNGAQVHSAIYRRFISQMTEEFRSFARMAAAYELLPEGIDDAAAIATTADPSMATEMHRSARGQLYLEMTGNPAFSPFVAARRFAETMQLPNPQELVGKPPENTATPAEQADAAIKMYKEQTARIKTNAEIVLKLASTLAEMAQAQQEGVNTALAAQQLQILKQVAQGMRDDADNIGTRNPGMEGGPGNAGPDQLSTPGIGDDGQNGFSGAEPQQPASAGPGGGTQPDTGLAGGNAGGGF